MAGISVIWVLAVVILAAIAAVFHYWFRKSIKIWWLPMGVRFLAYVLVGLLLLNPVSEGLKSERRKPRVWVVSDGSSSLREDTAAMKSWVRDFQDEWASKAELRFGILSGSLSFDSAQTQDLGRTRLDAISEMLAMQPMVVDAVVLLSDGQWNLGVDPRYAAWPAETKLYTVPFGLADRAPQFEIERWSMNSEVKVNEPFRSEWAYQLYGEFPPTASLVVLHKGKVLGKMPLGQREAGTLNMELKLSELGNQVLETQVVDASGKLWYRDQKNIRVLESGKKVLVLYNELHPDVGSITRSLKASHGLEVITQPVREPFPSEVDLIVQFGLTPIQLDRLPADVPVWHFPAPDQASATLSHRTKREWAQSGVWQGTGYWTQESEVYLEGMEDYPPLQMPVLKSGSMPESSMHAKQFALGNQTDFPLSVFLGTAGLEEGWFFGRGIWRWRAACYRRKQSFDAFDRWVLSVSQRLMAGSGARNALHLRTIPEKPRESEAFSVRLWKTGLDGQMSAEGEFALKLEKSSGLGEWSLVQESNLSRNADAWQTAFQGLDTGDYRLVANWEKGSSKLERSLAWKVIVPPLEPQLGADTNLLKSWALDHQGALLPSQYSGGMELPESRMEEQWTQWPWREQGLLLLLIAFLFGLEWFLRKWLGHI